MVKLKKDNAGLILESDAAPLSTQDVDVLIAHLKTFRAAMNPPVTMDFPTPNKAIQVTEDPRWFVASDAMLGLPMLSLREPGLGWIHFVLPKQEALKISDLLTRIAKAEAPAPTKAN